MNNGYYLYSNLLFAKAGNAGIPLSGTFELTSRCNLDCKMCYIHRRANDQKAIKTEKTTAEWISFAKECVQKGMLLLLLTGGEPLLRSDFKEIYTVCRRLGLLVSINTNATLMDDDMVEFFKKDPPARINITLYGASAETYGALCGDPSAYERVVRAILALKAAGIFVKINFSVTPYNAKDAERVYAFTKEHNLPLQSATYMFPPVRACEQGCYLADRLTPEQAAVAQIHYDKFRFTEDELRKRWNAQLNGIQVEDPDKECQEFPTERIRCRAGKTTFWVTWDGKIRPCGMMTEPSFELEPGKFEEAWKYIRTAREEIMVPAKCSSCEIKHACDQCAAMCYAETGSFTDVPTYMCEKTKAYLRLIQNELEEHNEG